MGNLFEQKYPNNIRTISGLINVPFQDDSVLECNTTLGAVAIQLLDIPTNFSTQYKLYIVDKNNNASVNNITVTAPVGYLINGASSFVINSNGASLLVRVASKTNYVGQYSVIGGGSGVAGHIIADESVNLPQQPILDFIGANVTVTNGVGRTIVTISGSGASIIDITNAGLLALITAGTVVAGQFYRVTDVTNADEGVVVQGIRVNGTTTVQGSGVYLNADYQNNGDYSGVAGFVAWKNMWNSFNPVAVVVGDVMIYQNIHYKNLTGVFSDGVNPPSLDAINWQPLPKSTTNGYMREVDFVKYNVSLNKVIYRADARLNEVDDYTDSGRNSLLLFQWGRNKVFGNKLRGNSLFFTTQSFVEFRLNVLDNSYIADNTPNIEAGKVIFNNLSSGSSLQLKNTRGEISYNNLSNGSEIIANGSGVVNANAVITLNSLDNTSSFNYDILAGSSAISQNKFISVGRLVYGVSAMAWLVGCSVQKCLFQNGGTLEVDSASGGIGLGFVGCEFSDSVYIKFDPVTNIYTEKKYRKGYSNWEYTLTPLDYALGVLTIPIGQEYNGLFTISGLTPADTIQKIVNLSTNHRSRFVPLPTQSNAFFHTPIAGAVANDMVSDAGVPNTLIGRADGTDYITYEKSGILNQRVDIVINA